MPEDIVGRLFGELAGTDLPVPASGAVIARGRQRRRRTRVRAALAVAAVVALVVAGASQLAGARTRTPPPATHARKSQSACQAAPDRALTAELAHPVPLGHQPIALSWNGAQAYAVVTANGFHGIAEENTATGAIVRHIDPLSARYFGGAGALTRNGDLIWVSYYDRPSGVTAGSSPVQMWSPLTGTVTELEPPGQDGVALSAPVLMLQYGKTAAWLQSDGRQREIVEANLGSGKVDVVARGYLSPPVFVGDALAWSAALTASGRSAHVVARSAIPFPSQQRIAVPVALRSAGASLMGLTPLPSWQGPIGLVASNAGATAYFSTNLTELFYSSAPSQPARLVLKITGDQGFTNGSLALGDGYLSWSTDSAATYVASTRSLAVATIANGSTDYGDVEGLGTYVLATRTATPKHGTAPVYLIRGSTIYGLSCARR